MRATTFLLGAALIAVTSSRAAEACSCSRTLTLADLSTFDLVFLGQVVDQTVREGRRWHHQFDATFFPVASWKGTPGREVLVSSGSGNTCDYFFVEPGWYIVTARRSKKSEVEKFRTSFCSANRYIANEQDLKEAISALGPPVWGRAQIASVERPEFYLCAHHLGESEIQGDAEGSQHWVKFQLTKQGQRELGDFLLSNMGRLVRLLVGDVFVSESRTSTLGPLSSDYYLSNGMSKSDAESLAVRLKHAQEELCGARRTGEVGSQTERE